MPAPPLRFLVALFFGPARTSLPCLFVRSWSCLAIASCSAGCPFGALALPSYVLLAACSVARPLFSPSPPSPFLLLSASAFPLPLAGPLCSFCCGPHSTLAVVFSHISFSAYCAESLPSVLCFLLFVRPVHLSAESHSESRLRALVLVCIPFFCSLWSACFYTWSFRSPRFVFAHMLITLSRFRDFDASSPALPPPFPPVSFLVGLRCGVLSLCCF